MAITYKISVPEPCAENWNEMTPTEKGRYCSVCATNVIDFSVMTDQEIAAYLKSNKGKTCGRFASTQLNREIATKAKPRNSMPYKIAASLLLASTSQWVVAQETQTYPSENHTQAQPKETQKTQTITRTITGIVLDDKKMPIEFVTISLDIPNTEISVFSDENGRFELILDNVMPDSSISIIIEYQGHEAQTIDVTPETIFPIEVFCIQKDYGLIGDISIVRKRWWQFWK